MRLAHSAPLREFFVDPDTLIEEMNCGLVVRDGEGMIHFVNDRMVEWIGRPRSELLGKPIETLLPEEVREIVQEEIRETAAGNLRARLGALQRADGTTFPAIFLPQLLIDDEGNHVGGFSVVVDLGGVQTAKPLGRGGPELRETLHRIAFDLQSLSLVADIPGADSVPLGHSALSVLTAREREVLGELMRGMRSPGIAKKLFISPHTVRNHLKSIYRKLDVGGQAELIERVRAIAAGGDGSG